MLKPLRPTKRTSLLKRRMKSSKRRRKRKRKKAMVRPSHPLPETPISLHAAAASVTALMNIPRILHAAVASQLSAESLPLVSSSLASLSPSLP